MDEVNGETITPKPEEEAPREKVPYRWGEINAQDDKIDSECGVAFCNVGAGREGVFSEPKKEVGPAAPFSMVCRIGCHEETS